MAAGSESLCSTLLFVGLFVFVSADQETITAESGQNVTLTCRAPNHSIDIVEWSRADLKSQRVFVCWDGQVLPEEQHPSFKNRVDLQDRQMKDGDVSVILKNVTFNDEGTYRCRVQREDDSVKLLSIIYLRVVAPPGPGGDTGDGGSVGLIVGLSVAAVLLVAPAVFVIYRKQFDSWELRSSEFGFHGKMTMVSYVQKKGKAVVLLSTMHDDKSVDNSSQKKKPEVIQYYNKTKGGVDTVVHMVSSYTCLWRTRKWPMVLWYNMLDVATLNVYTNFSAQRPDHMSGASNA
ncbi:uncharacterized protein LOC115778042 [Archocentrus centrarchus]|uniref:uncharacterized protein LOC115776524 n=1 Tax=Archocentrus centrarchus TaxID=63155 RepID=UPI0011E9B849|nr:uncharacterized protein LOC115776524 [Archocentrus centrarchus]XP_030581927.1 uncharacterized protein LOC115778042 [Archocentrus centrarchus]